MNLDLFIDLSEEQLYASEILKESKSDNGNSNSVLT